MALRKARPRKALAVDDYARLAAFRRALREFLRFSDDAAARVGLTAQHYQAMLVLRACPPHERITINDLARQLLIKHNSAVGLVDRLVAGRLVAREKSATDRRKVELTLTARGDRVLARLADAHRRDQFVAPDRTFVGIDSVLNDQIEKDVRSIVEDMAKDPSANGRLGQQIGDLYNSWMDEGTVEKLGTAPLKPYLAQIAAAKTRGDLVDLFATPGFNSPVGISIYPDLKNPTRYAVYAGQHGLGMPNRDYYLLKGAKYDAYRKAYRNYLIDIQRLAGISTPEARAAGTHRSGAAARR